MFAVAKKNAVSPYSEEKKERENIYSAWRACCIILAGFSRWDSTLTSDLEGRPNVDSDSSSLD